MGIFSRKSKQRRAEKVTEEGIAGLGESTVVVPDEESDHLPGNQIVAESTITETSSNQTSENLVANPFSVVASEGQRRKSLDIDTTHLSELSTSANTANMKLPSEQTDKVSTIERNETQTRDRLGDSIWAEARAWLTAVKSAPREVQNHVSSQASEIERLIDLHRRVLAREQSLTRQREEIFEECGGMLEALKLIESLGEERNWRGEILQDVRRILNGQ